VLETKAPPRDNLADPTLEHVLPRGCSHSFHTLLRYHRSLMQLPSTHYQTKRSQPAWALPEHVQRLVKPSSKAHARMSRHCDHFMCLPMVLIQPCRRLPHRLQLLEYRFGPEGTEDHHPSGGRFANPNLIFPASIERICNRI
jgi:hypothetical protein